MRPSQRGFTLLELLISMAMLVVILVIALGALRLGGRSVAAGERRMEANERFRTVLSLLGSQVESQLPLTLESDTGKRLWFKGDGKSLRVATTRSIRTGTGAYVVVEYRIEDGGDGTEVLVARERSPVMDGGADIPLIRADRMQFDYFYRDPAEEQGRWYEALEDGMVLPGQVRFRVAFGKTELVEIFPVRVQAALRPAAGGRP